MIMGERSSASGRGWCKALGTDWRRPHSSKTMTVSKALKAIRPFRESAVGWTHRSLRSVRTRALWKLNEHGPALNVFWTRGNELGAAVRLATIELQEAMRERCFRSSTRTRWVTERIASAEGIRNLQKK